MRKQPFRETGLLCAWAGVPHWATRGCISRLLRIRTMRGLSTHFAVSGKYPSGWCGFVVVYLQEAPLGNYDSALGLMAGPEGGA